MKLNDLFLTESAGLQFEEGLIRNVKIVGPVSKNGREYSWPALKKGAPLYEGTQVYVDHPAKPGQGRAARDRFGRLVNVRHVPGDGNRGDLEYLESHPLAESVKEDLRRGLGFFGLSHVADGSGRKSGRKTIVESIDRVYEVDLVTNPATVRSLMEQVVAEQDQAPEQTDAAVATDQAFAQAAVAVLTDKSLSKEDKLKKISDILDAHEEIQGGGEGPESGSKPASEQVALAEQVRALTEKVEQLLAAKPAPAGRYVKPKVQEVTVTEQAAHAGVGGGAVPKDPAALRKWLRSDD